jgi:multiple antibiotic resistance protein
MAEMSNALLLVFAALFPIINPPGTAMIFYASTRYRSREQRAMLAKWIAIYAFLIINASLYIGGYVLQVFGVSVPVLRVAGGIVVTATAWKLLNAQGQGADEPAQSPRGDDLRASAFYPLTMPLTTGPGTIAVTIALGGGRPQDPGVVGWFVVGALLATIAIAALIYVCYRYADRVESAIGATASDAIARLFAFILMCIGIQIGWAGISELLASLRDR